MAATVRASLARLVGGRGAPFHWSKPVPVVAAEEEAGRGMAVA